MKLVELHGFHSITPDKTQEFRSTPEQLNYQKVLTTVDKRNTDKMQLSGDIEKLINLQL